MDTPLPASSVKLFPLNEGGNNEIVANLLTRLIGDDARAATSALLIITGLQAFLDTDNPAMTARLWEPLIVARDLKRKYGGQAYRKAVEETAAKHNTDIKEHHLYLDVCQILISDPEQEKNIVDRT